MPKGREFKGDRPVLRLAGDDEQDSDDDGEKEEDEVSDNAGVGAHAEHHCQVKDEDEDVEQADHLHDEHARLLSGRSGVYPREDGWAQVCGRL